MIDGFKAFKYYTALKLHFTDKKFDVFQNRARLRGSYDKFVKRNDKNLFEKLAKRVKDDKICIQYIAANFMYRNPDMIWNDEDSDKNYNQYIKRKQSITHLFEDDLQTIINTNSSYTFNGNNIPDVFKLWLTNKISLETVVILDQMDDIVSRMENKDYLSLLLGSDLLLVKKASKFVKYDSYKIMDQYINFISEVKQKNGQDVSLSTVEA